MLRIYDREVFTIEIDHFDVGQNLESIMENPDYNKMLFVLTKHGTIVAASNFQGLRNSNMVEKVFYNTENVFWEASNFCRENKIPYNTYFPVLNEEGKYRYLLHYTDNRIYSAGLPREGARAKEFYDYDTIDKESLDYSLVESAGIYVFFDLEEYTYMLARLLAFKYPHKQVIFLNKKISYFPELTKIARFEDSIYNTFGKEQCLWITSNGKNYEDEYLHIYNSINVMNSLFWCSKRECFGEKNKNQQILLIDYAGGEAGLSDYIKYTYAYFWIAKKRGWKCVVDLSHKPNQYLTCEGENEDMWDYFFESLSDMPLSEVYESASVIRCSANEIKMTVWFDNPYIRMVLRSVASDHVMKTVRFNKETEEEINKYMPEALKRKENNKVLGVILRGTDYREEANKSRGRTIAVAKLEKVVAKCKYIMNLYGYEYLFVATEDSEYFEKMKEEFGEKCLYVDQKRVCHDYSSGGYIACSKLLDIKDGKEFGRRYLAVIQSLANCQALISNMQNGTVWIASRLNDSKYQHIEVVQP